MALFTWELCGAMNRPNTFDASNLGLNYTDGADSRWREPGLVCGPQRTSLALNTVGGTAANTNAGAMIQQTAGSNWFLYVLRGTRVTKIQVPTANGALSLASTQPTNSATGDLAARGHSIVVTNHDGSTAIMSVGQEATNTYHNLTTVAAENAADTWSACNETTGGGQSRIVAMAADRMAGLNGQGIYGNILTAAVTADASSWQELAKYRRDKIIPTGFAMTENLWVIGTNRGPLVLNAQYREFFPALGLLPASLDNCRAMHFNPFGAGLFVPLVGQTRLMRGAYSQRVGPEAYLSPNPVQGTTMGIGSNTDYAYWAIRNPMSAVTYIVAVRPREPNAWHGEVFSFYCLDSFSDACEWVQVLEDPGSIRTNPVLVVGNDDDLNYYRIGRTPNWTEDVSGTNNYLYRSDTAQSAYGNRMHFDAPMDVTAIVFSGQSLASGRTLTAKVQYQSVTGQESTMTVVAENRTGEQVLKLPQTIRNVRAFNPIVTLQSNVTSASPVLEHGRISIVAEPSK